MSYPSIDPGRLLKNQVTVQSDVQKREFVIEVVEAATAVGTGDGLAYFPCPSTLAGLNLTAVRGCVASAGVTGNTDVQIYNLTQTADVLSTKLQFDAATTDDGNVVIDAAEDDITAGDVLRIDVDAVHSGTAPNGLYITLEFTAP